MLENRVLRKIFGSKKEEAKRGGRKLLSKRFYGIYSSPNLVRLGDEMKEGETC